MKITVMNKQGRYIEKNILLQMSNISEYFFEEWFTKTFENKSYFMIYLNTKGSNPEKHTYFQVTIPFDYAPQFGKIMPVYEEKLTQCNFYFNNIETICETTDDENLILINVCIRALLEDWVCCEFKERKGYR